MKKLPLTDEEIALFQATVKGVRPLKASKQILVTKQPKLLIKPKVPIFLDEVRVPEEVAAVRSEESLSFRRDGIQNKIMKKLRQGVFRTEAELDLHGMRSEEAETAVQRFIARCLERQLYCVSIVHGKGGNRGEIHPVLKNKLNQWLRSYSAVLAFHSAPVRKGGVGAVLVLLKRVL